MSVTADSEDLSLSQIAKKAKCSIATAWRWALYGIRGVRLESWLKGGRRFSSAAALQRFNDRLNANSDAVARQGKSIEKSGGMPLADTDKFLDDAGI
jgi:hypothetical protein